MHAHRNHQRERDVLAHLPGDIDRGITALPAGSPWRAWLARPSRLLRAAACLPLVRAVGRER
jgi:hypothetical protein